MSAYRNWKELRADCEACTKCSLSGMRNHVVFGEGDIHADVMFIGEGPGQYEDETGRPFVGPGGRMLSELMEEAGIRREECYIANVIKCRPPRNRDPLPEEIQACMPFLRAQTAFLKPKIIVGLGRYAAGLLLGRNVRMTREHGSVERVKSFIIIPTFHPAALLHNSMYADSAKADFRVIREQIDALQES